MASACTKRMRMIADDLAEEGNYTRAASVYECAAERDALWKLKDNIRLIVECETKPAQALKGIQDLLNEYDDKRKEQWA